MPYDKVSVERIATGFAFTEGPVWLPEGALLFSDIPNNRIVRWSEADGVSVFREPSGCDDPASNSWNRGSNGLALDREGRLVICEHGNRRVTCLGRDGSLTVLADRYDGLRLNSPNDIVVKSDGSIWFTDPPYGMDGRNEDPAKEQPVNGVYCLHNGSLTRVADDMPWPNGLAFSPDEKYLYVSNSGRDWKVWVRYPVNGHSLGTRELFFDVTDHSADSVPDGFRARPDGTLYCTGPGGLHIISPDRRQIAEIAMPEKTANVVWAGDDLYVCASTSIYRVRGLV